MTKSATARHNKGSITNVSHRNIHPIAFSDRKGELIEARPAYALRLLYELLEEYAPSWYTQKYHEVAEAALNRLKRR